MQLSKYTRTALFPAAAFLIDPAVDDFSRQPGAVGLIQACQERLEGGPRRYGRGVSDQDDDLGDSSGCVRGELKLDPMIGGDAGLQLDRVHDLFLADYPASGTRGYEIPAPAGMAQSVERRFMGSESLNGFKDSDPLIGGRVAAGRGVVEVVP